MANGLNWKEYGAHPRRLRTCWACKNAHDSVVTETQACQKFNVLKASSIFRRLQTER